MSMPSWLRPKLEPGHADTADALRVRAQRAEDDEQRARDELMRVLNEAAMVEAEIEKLRAGAALARIELDTALSRVGKSGHDVRLCIERARAAVADDVERSISGGM